MNHGTKLLAFFNLILLFIGFAGILGGAAGDSWWEGGIPASYKESLLKTCDGTRPCETRTALKFRENERGMSYAFSFLFIFLFICNSPLYYF